MKLSPFPFQTIDWNSIPKEEKTAITGTAHWQIFMMNDVRVRMVTYSADYFADHWCSKGHIIFCIDGEMEAELEDGRKFILTKGMTYHVGDDCEAHRSYSKNGCILFIVD